MWLVPIVLDNADLNCFDERFNTGLNLIILLGAYLGA